MDYNIDGLSWITGYDLSKNEETLKKQGIKSVSLISDVSGDWKPRIHIKMFDGTEESYIVDYDSYYEHLRKEKLLQIINKLNGKMDKN